MNGTFKTIKKPKYSRAFSDPTKNRDISTYFHRSDGWDNFHYTCTEHHRGEYVDRKYRQYREQWSNSSICGKSIRESNQIIIIYKIKTTIHRKSKDVIITNH